jgi:hypothetical protein
LNKKPLSLKEKWRRGKKLLAERQDKIKQVRFMSKSSFVEVYEVKCGDDVSYLPSTSVNQAKIDYVMAKQYYAMPQSKRSKGLICNHPVDTFGITAKLVTG